MTGGLVDWRRAGRRVGWVVLAWATAALVTGGAALALAGWSVATMAAAVCGIGAFLSVVAVVAWSAWTGMLRAGERGERLSDGDVGVMPPQMSPARPGRRLRRRPTQARQRRRR